MESKGYCKAVTVSQTEKFKQSNVIYWKHLAKVLEHAGNKWNGCKATIAPYGFSNITLKQFYILDICDPRSVNRQCTYRSSNPQTPQYLD